MSEEKLEFEIGKSCQSGLGKTILIKVALNQCKCVKQESVVTYPY